VSPLPQLPPDRRKVLATGLAVVAAAWIAPIMISTPAYAAGTNPSPLIIDDFTVAVFVAANGGITQPGVGAIAGDVRTTTMQLLTPGSASVSIVGGLATFSSAGSTWTGHLRYQLSVPFDLVAAGSAIDIGVGSVSATSTVVLTLVDSSFNSMAVSQFLPLGFVGALSFPISSFVTINLTSIVTIDIAITTATASTAIVLNTIEIL
jgi:hypothetical protein